MVCCHLGLGEVLKFSWRMGKLSINIISESTTQDNANDSEKMSLIQKRCL
jgi:hypothetical protein